MLSTGRIAKLKTEHEKWRLRPRGVAELATAFRVAFLGPESAAALCGSGERDLLGLGFTEFLRCCPALADLRDGPREGCGACSCGLAGGKTALLLADLSRVEIIAQTQHAWLGDAAFGRMELRKADEGAVWRWPDLARSDEGDGGEQLWLPPLQVTASSNAHTDPGNDGAGVACSRVAPPPRELRKKVRGISHSLPLATLEQWARSQAQELRVTFHLSEPECKCAGVWALEAFVAGELVSAETTRRSRGAAPPARLFFLVQKLT